jgi:ABC-type glutathione transport system ATPase component
MRRQVQIIFQNAKASLNPSMTIGEIIQEPLDVHRLGSVSDRLRQVRETLDLVGLSENVLIRFAHQLSGGEQQRVALARALILKPSLIICDEPISSLDQSTQMQIVTLLLNLQRELNVGYFFITHDFSLVESLATEIAVMYQGEIVESGPVDQVLASPMHSYTKTLLAASFFSKQASSKRYQFPA